MVITAFTAFALDFSDGDFAYHTQTWSGTNIVEVTGLSAAGKTKATNGNMTLIVPGHVTYNNTKYQVAGIESSAFAGQTGITTVRIHAGVRFVRASAFMNCSDLATLILPSTVTLANDAFAGCGNLKTVSWAVMQWQHAEDSQSVSDAQHAQGHEWLPELHHHTRKRCLRLYLQHSLSDCHQCHRHKLRPEFQPRGYD